MTFQIQVGGRTRQVVVRRAGRRLEVTLDSRPVTVDLARTNSGWSLIIGPAEAGPHDSNVGAGFSRPGRSYEVALEEHGGSTTVYVNGLPIRVAINGGTGRSGRRDSSDEGFDGPRRIVAPMPGRIVKVLVKPGEAVAARQGLVVVEAMKMENELRAPGPGTVTEVRVTEGASVEANAILVVLE
ncbi:MAG TPA: biotin/lipoyl-containing protein [Vicinamibacterales bacterium]